MEFLVFSGCSASAEENIPYQISGQMVIDDTAGYENACFNFTFGNGSEKTVSEFTLVFFLFDEDGDVPTIGNGSIVTTVSCNVGKNDYVTGSVDLIKYLNYIPEDPYNADYIYVSKIVYSDKSEWSDPFGVYAF